MNEPNIPVCLNVSLHIDERWGGLAASMPHFCNAVTGTGRFVSRLAALCDEDEVTPASFLPADVNRFPIGRLKWFMDRSLDRRLEGLIREAAIVHIHGLWREYSVLASRLCRKHGKPYVISAHGMLQPWTLNNGKWKKRAYLSAVELPVLRGAAGLRALTRTETDDYRRLGLQNPVKVVPNGVDVPAGISPDEFLNAFPGLAGRRLILFLGRIHPKKGIDILCRAWAHLEKDLPDVQLVIAGPDEGDTLSDLTELIRTLGIDNRVTFTGLLRGPTKWSALAASTLFVLPSHSEGFSVSILEALGCGLPVLVSHNCNFPEITETACGWEIDADEGQLINALAGALRESPEILSARAGNGRRLVATRYTWAAIGTRAADMLEEWSGNSRPCAIPAGESSCRQ
jgi:glycosyltransferase involved in cell wall biosynthesis